MVHRANGTWFSHPLRLRQASSKFPDGLVLQPASQMSMIGHWFAAAYGRRAEWKPAKPPYHPDSIRMPRAKFCADLLKTVGMHNEQTNKHTDRQTHTFGYAYIRLTICDLLHLIPMEHLHLGWGLHPSQSPQTWRNGRSQSVQKQHAHCTFKTNRQ